MTDRVLLGDYLEQFNLELCTTYKKSDNLRTEEYRAAVKIQAWFRGIRTRCYLKILHAHTIRIQKNWRGFLGRREYRKVLAEAVVRLRNKMYHHCATKIQSAWRGYLTRKYKFNFYARKVYLDALKEVGHCVRQRLLEFEAASREKMDVQVEVNTKDRLWEWAKSNHYKISTFCQPGIYNKPRNYMRDPREHMLQAAGKMLAKENLPWAVEWKQIKPITEAFLQGSDSTKSDENLHETVESVKIRGPFRSASALRRWKRKPTPLSLRVLTDYFSLDKARQAEAAAEWVRRVHDEPFHAGHISSPHYERLLMTTSTYGSTPYGTKHFRFYEDVNSDMTKTNKIGKPKPRFRTVLPPIEQFDRLDRDYSRDYVKT
ncbi:hypothetical protein FBUS_09860 [Fasciolopsis buskii]|uniref:Spermatogenesis-associated protein 17 n=1 Tax=Fasciolopsis buskii TaxID=27845 RepID=A0A8E0RNT8_9TREM|nr:hypothetical protein FBUS_09860 [Fasciolopsis buski]